ncbi:MAG TPA: hypothetical protein VFA11_01720 [Acidimicrobiales bacterium]|nr:hypothetical protein [Acidimicrobiales bacterium]
MRRRRNKGADPGWTGDVAAECQAFVDGELARYLDHRRRPVPAWAWVNAVAHVGRDVLVDLAHGRVGQWKKRAARSWARATLPALAARLLEQSGMSEEEIRAIQLERLIPLELALIDRAPLTRPEELVDRVTTAVTPPVTAKGVAPALGRGLGRGRVNRVAFMLLGPATVSPGVVSTRTAPQR